MDSGAAGDGGQAESDLDGPRPDTFVLRVARGDAGQLAGVVQHVHSGQKRRFEGLDGLDEAIRMMAREQLGRADPGGAP